MEDVAPPKILPSAHWQRFGNTAQIVSALVAVCALIGIYLQVQANFRFSAANSAREVYRAYLQMAVRYPQLAYPQDTTSHDSMSVEEKARYDWFVSYLLYTCEQIVGTFPRDEQWRRTCLEQVGYHVAYLCSSDAKDEITHYSLAMQSLIAEAAGQSRVAACKKT